MTVGDVAANMLWVSYLVFLVVLTGYWLWLGVRAYFRRFW